MGENRCLYCYELLEKGSGDFHESCSKKFFGSATPLLVPYTEDQMQELAEQVIKSQLAVPGAQPKLSLTIDKRSNSLEPRRFTLLGLWGDYILKPPTAQYQNLPELEDLTLHLAEISGIHVVPHSLIRLASGKLSYITRRIDRESGRKIHMEDMCQLTGRLTEHKYHGSYEQMGKAIISFSEDPLLDTINFFEQVLFSFLTGNADMHLKNFSLIDRPNTGYVLAPAYDMVATSLVVEGDDEDLALTLNGKKRRIRRKDFLEAFSRFNMDQKSIENIFGRFEKSLSHWESFIDRSFLPGEMKKEYKELIMMKARRVGIIK